MQDGGCSSHTPFGLFFCKLFLVCSVTILAVYSPFFPPTQAKALTIGKLMEIAPAGTMDPTPFIYDSTMYTMAGLMVRPAVRCTRFHGVAIMGARARELANTIGVKSSRWRLLLPQKCVLSFPRRVRLFDRFYRSFGVCKNCKDRLGIVLDTQIFFTFPDRVG